MAKSIKLDNELLLDSTSIAHNKKTLTQQFENNIYQLNEANVVSTIQSLNTMTTPGVYNLTTGSIDIEGLPPSFSEAFTLIVSIDKAGNPACIRQELTREEKSFVRHTADSGTTWSDWAIMATYNVGDVVITSTNVGVDAMAARFGGTWELIDKHFRNSYSNTQDDIFTTQSGVTSSGEVAFIRSGNLMRIRVSMVTDKSLDDNNATLGKINLTELGIGNFLYTPYFLAYVTDDAWGIVQIGYNTGTLTWVGLIGESSSIASGATIQLDFTLPTHRNYMNDEFCNKFYWQRIS